MADCIPIHYAPSRAWGEITVARTLNAVNENSAPVDTLKNILVDAGWTVVDNKPASGTLFYLIGLPIAGSGITQVVLTWQTNNYVVYDPIAGHGGPLLPNTIWVPEGATSEDTLDALCLTASGTDYSWTRISSNTIQVIATSSTSGTAGNGQSYTGQFGAAGTTSDGGWILQSQSANSRSQFFATIYGGGGSGGVNIQIDLDETTISGTRRSTVSLGNLFFSNTFKFFANAYQFALFNSADTSHGPIVLASAPYIYSDLVSTLGYTVLVTSGAATVLGDPSGYNASIAQTSVTLVMDGLGYPYTYRTNQSVIFGLLWRYPDSAPLVVTGGKTIALEDRLLLPNSAGVPQIVGALWDTFVESCERQPNVDGIEYDSNNWVVLLTQGGGNGGFNTRTSGTIWLARPESGPILS